MTNETINLTELIKKYIKTLFFIYLGFFTLDKEFAYSGCLFEGCEISENNLLKNKKQIQFFKSENIPKNSQNIQLSRLSNRVISSYEFLKEESLILDKIFQNLLLSSKEIESQNNSQGNINIESNIQYFEDDIFFAEGNVKVFLPNGILTSDKISYDKKNKIFIAYRNINFEKGDQFFKADYLEYNITLENGFVNNIFGIIDFKTIDTDFRFSSSKKNKDYCENEDFDLTDITTETELLSSTNQRYQNLTRSKKLNFNLSKVTNWRFKSKRINLKDNQLQADLIDFTNDPFNNPQFIIKSKNLTGEVIDGKTKLKSSSTSVNFDNKLTLPIIGKRTISDENSELRWGIGYESGDKDGFYIIRNFNSIDINNNFTLDMQPYFLLQRAIKGKSNSFRSKDSSEFSSNVEKNINIYDYFALNSKLKGEFYNWNLNINTDLKTLNPENFYDAFSLDLNLHRNLYGYSRYQNDKNNAYCSDKSSLVNNSQNYSLDLGFYSLFDKDDLYSSYGTKLVSSYNSKKQNLSKNYNFVFDIGDFQGKGVNTLNDNYELKKLNRYGLSSSMSHLYKIFEFNNNSSSYSSIYNYSPSRPEKGLFINSKISAGFYKYSNSSYQNLLSFSFGPSITFGSLTRNFLDYTNVSIFPEFIIKNGQSPFSFDDFNNDSRIKFKLNQHLIGPLILGFQSDYNINTNSSKYSNFQNKKLSLILSRRAYSVSLSYAEDDKEIFLGFEIFNFDNTKFRKDF